MLLKQLHYVVNMRGQAYVHELVFCYFLAGAILRFWRESQSKVLGPALNTPHLTSAVE